MGLIDRLQRVSGIVKNRLASATGALRASGIGRAAARVIGRIPAPLRRVARISRIFTPAGAALTALSFAPAIRRGLIVGRQAVTRGISFVGGQRVVTAAGAGATVGVLGGRRKGETTRPSQAVAEAGFKAARPRTKRKKRRAAARDKPRKRGRIPAHGHRVISVSRKRRVSTRGKRATHRSPRHRGHKRVSFTTKSGQKVSFLANPKARHR